MFLFTAFVLCIGFVIINFSLIVSGRILRTLQSDWFRDRAVFSYLLTTVTVTAGKSAGAIVKLG